MRFRCDSRGFLVLEILIAGLILTAGVAATMILFRTGYAHLARARSSNTLAVKATQIPALLQTVNLEKKKGRVDMGNGVRLFWKARIAASGNAVDSAKKEIQNGNFELLLYQVQTSLRLDEMSRNYSVYVFRHRKKGLQ